MMLCFFPAASVVVDVVGSQGHLVDNVPESAAGAARRHCVVQRSMCQIKISCKIPFTQFLSIPAFLYFQKDDVAAPSLENSPVRSVFTR